MRALGKTIALGIGLFITLLNGACAYDTAAEDATGSPESVDTTSEPLTCDFDGWDAWVTIPNSPTVGSYWGASSSLPTNQYTSCGSGGDAFQVGLSNPPGLTYKAVGKWTDPKPTVERSCVNSHVEVVVRGCFLGDCAWIVAEPVTVTGMWFPYGGGSCVIPDATTTAFESGVWDYFDVAVRTWIGYSPPQYHKASGGLKIQ